MAIHDLRLDQTPTSMRLAPVGPTSAPSFSFVLFTFACALASFAFACATPFAAFAVVAAAMLPFSSALLVVLGAWIVNQGIGFGALHYPRDANTILWGLAIGAAALAATLIAAAVLRVVSRTSAAIAFGLALLAAYAVYELVLFGATPFLGGEGAFTAAVVARIGALNIFWLIGLVAASEIVRLLNRRYRTAS
jgi:hypothetical protein